MKPDISRVQGDIRPLTSWRSRELVGYNASTLKRHHSTPWVRGGKLHGEGTATDQGPEPGAARRSTHTYSIAISYILLPYFYLVHSHGAYPSYWVLMVTNASVAIIKLTSQNGK